MNTKNRLIEKLLKVAKKHKILTYPVLALVAVISVFSYFFNWSTGAGKRVVAIVMVTFGTYCFAKPFIQDEAILWVFVSALFVLGILFVIIGCMQKPVKAKVKSVDKNEKKNGKRR